MREPLLCATTLSSLDAAVVTRRRRRMTSFAFPSGGRAIGRVSTPPTPSATTAARRRVRRLHQRLRLRGLRPERAAAAAPDGKDCIGIASHASDADCDDGGPGSEFQQADRPYGSDCGPRMPTHAALTPPRRPGARVALAAAFSIVGCYYFVTSCELSTGRTRASTHTRYCISALTSMYTVYTLHRCSPFITALNRGSSLLARPVRAARQQGGRRCGGGVAVHVEADRCHGPRWRAVWGRR